MPLYVVEARDANGDLVTAPDKQPPFAQASEGQLFSCFFTFNPERETANFGEVRNWFMNRGWPFRERTW